MGHYLLIEFLNYGFDYKKGHEIYKDADIFTIEHPLGKNAACASAKIIAIYNNEFSHTIPTNYGSSGCLIIPLHDNLNSIQVKGIHKASKISKELIFGTFIAEIFNASNKITNGIISVDIKTSDGEKNCSICKNVILNESKKNVLRKNNKISLSLIKNICAIKITCLFKKLLKRKKEAHNKLFRNLTKIPSSYYITDLNNSKLDVDLAQEETCIYFGTLYNEKKDDLGLEIFKNSKAKYFGIFKNGKRDQAGKFKIHNNFENFFYYGEIQGIYASGFGLFKDKKENKTYEGMWENSLKNGYGIETYEDNSEYRGCFLNGKKEGIGICKWNDNSFYEGEWKENKMNGYGILKFNNGSLYKGEWKRNRYDGFGEYIHPGIKKYYGFFREDKRYGFGIEVRFKERKILIGFWKDNNIGIFGKLFVNEKIIYGIWKNGKLVETFNKREFLKKIKREHKNYLNFFVLDDCDAILSVVNEKI